MKVRVGFKMFLLPGTAAEYKKRHDFIWPELASLLKDQGIQDYSIFLDESRMELFAVLSIDDPKMLNTLPDTMLMKKWWSFMRDLMHTNPDGSPKTVALQEVFYLP